MCKAKEGMTLMEESVRLGEREMVLRDRDPLTLLLSR